MIRFAFHIQDSQEVDQGHEPPTPEAIRGSGDIEYSHACTKATKVSTLRGPIQIANLQGTLCVSTQKPYTDVYPNFDASKAHSALLLLRANASS